MLSKNKNSMEFWKALCLCVPPDYNRHPTSGYCTGVDPAVSLCVSHNAVVHASVSQGNPGQTQSAELPVSWDKQRCPLIRHMDLISLNNKLWSLVGNLTVPVDVLICSNVRVAAGHIYFLPFIGVHGEGLGGLSKAPCGCGNEHNPHSYPRTRWLEPPMEFPWLFLRWTYPLLFLPTIHMYPFTCHLCILLLKRCQGHTYSGTSLLSPSLPWMWVISNPEHLWYPQHKLHIKAE